MASGSHRRLEVLERYGKIYYSDIDPSFRLDPTTNDVAKTTNNKSVEDSLIGIISTRKGERPFEPDFGCDIHSSLFDNMSDYSAYSVQKAIEESVRNYEPRVILRNVVAIPDYDNNIFNVGVEYSIVTNTNYIYSLKLRLRDD